MWVNEFQTLAVVGRSANALSCKQLKRLRVASCARSLLHAGQGGHEAVNRKARHDSEERDPLHEPKHRSQKPRAAANPDDERSPQEHARVEVEPMFFRTFF